MAAESNSIEVYWNGQKLDTIALDGVGLTNTKWQTFSYDLPADADSGKLEFRAVGTSDSRGGYLDDVQFQQYSEASVTHQVSVQIDAVADRAIISAQNVAGDEDSAIGLNLSARLADNDGSETLSVSIHGLPEGATLSAGTRLADGSWSVKPDQLADLKVQPPTDYAGTMRLTMVATTQEATGDTAEVSYDFRVSVNEVNDAPFDLDISGTTVSEDAAPGTVIGKLSATDRDGDRLTYNLSGPDAANFIIVENELRVSAKPRLDFETNLNIR